MLKVLSAALLLTLLQFGFASGQTSKLPNVVLIISDDQGGVTTVSWGMR